jgi:hypothetical protein
MAGPAGTGYGAAMRRLPLLALLLVLLLPAAAGAAPGDPPIEVLTPPDGAAFAPTEDGIAVTYTCPVYHSYDPVIATGGPSEYGLAVATSPALGTDGRLRSDTAVARDQGHESNALPEGRCVSVFGGEGAATPGTYYVQVWRLCVICERDYEAAPVRRIEIVVNAKPVVTPPRRAYGGYIAFYRVALAGVPDGAEVILQRRAKGRWRGAGVGFASDEVAEVGASLPAGRQRIRAVVTIGGSRAAGAARSYKVRKARNWRTGARDDGRYTGELSLKLRVSGDGRTVRGFEMDVPTLCPGITPGTFTTEIGNAFLPAAHIAPDGTFAAAVAVGGGAATEVRGRVHDGKVKGRVKHSLGVCSGDTALEGTKR